MLFSCESYPKGKQLTLNPRQDHMKIIYHINCELFSYIYIFINCDNMLGTWIKCYFHILEIAHFLKRVIKNVQSHDFYCVFKSF